MTLPLPPQVSATAFATALDKFASVLGPEWVYREESDVLLYRDAYSPAWGEPDERLPSAALAPATAEQVQQIVQIANQYKIPLYPISTGKNLGYGGSAPNMTGTVVVDLKRMNKIIEVDDRRHFAIVEPGVSYFDLYQYIRERNLKVMIDCPDPGWGSLVGNALDHGVGYTLGHYRDHFGSHSGMEVVLPNGEIMRTGMGALPNSKTWGEFRYGFGPWVDGLFGQGNFGIVTKMGFRLMPEPEHFLAGTITVPRRQDLIPLVDMVNVLEHMNGLGAPFYSSPLLPISFADPAVAKIANDPNVTDADLNKLASDRNLHYWHVELPFYGPKEVVQAAWNVAARQITSKIPGSKAEILYDVSFPMADRERRGFPHKVALGIPNLDIFTGRSEHNPIPPDGHLWFASVVPKTGEALFEAHKVFAEASRKVGAQPVFSPFSPPCPWMPYTFILINFLPISKSDPELNKRSRQLFEHYIRAAADAGYGEYRAPPMFHDVVSDVYSFNDHALRKFVETMKDAVDPNGIFAPGRCGIWPKRFRGNRQ
ncbi:FAD-binding oxidoreductase [Xanthomonas hyacinthi]|uniref:FAD-binding oxidoreductase n=1 Tax=Xanthomonas hyacinthi TaxID=56455 RepID=A0A2S7F321_9XANT|nr:FAD-binding oxidoreductase [Xanthomonas hyacinthi]KLD75646.1 p-cresol methylhydroxylase [Xanthomonas hyacinthi DSM 19077]PPU99850.1 FAD-binding oxidoreductase [Xanthomonas hyacinthi]QGY76014.1 FAD-binding oxidoreductase [Xanthomonas hyacinthi]